jgi:hypothetical protein
MNVLWENTFVNDHIFLHMMYIQAKFASLQTCFLLIINDLFSSLQDGSTDYESPTLGAHAHAHTHGFWVGMGAMLLFIGGHGCDIIVHGWTWVGIGFIRSNQDLV